MNKKPSLFTLLLLMPFAAISALLFTPALPSIANEFLITNAVAGFSMTVFLFGYALGNLPYGPFAKRFGRKPTIFLGVSLGVFGIFLILLSQTLQSWNLFLLGRFVSALGSSVGMKIAFTIIADSFEGPKATKIISITSLSFAIAPSLSVAIGGILTSHFGWPSCFYALIIYNIIILGLTLKLPETAPYLDVNALNYKSILKTFSKKFTNPQLILSALIMGSITSILYLFSSLAPFIAISNIKVDPETFGMLNFIPPIGLISGCLISSKLSERKSSFFSLSLGLFIAFTMSIVMWALFSLGDISIYTLFLPIPFLYFGTSLVFNNASSLALQHVRDKSNGSAVMSFANISLATFSVLCSGFFKSADPIVLPTFFVILTVLISILRYKLKNIISQ